MAIAHHRRLALRLAGAFVSSAIGVNAAAAADTLTDALSKAYATNPQILAERAKLRATDEGVSQALGGWRPTITATGSGGVQKQVSDSTFPQEQYRQPRTANLTIQQPLYRGGRTTAGTRQAENNVLAERARLALAEEQVLLNVVTAYMNVVQAQSVLDLDHNNEDRLRRQLQAAQDRFSAGQVTKTDVSQAEAALSGAIADRIQAEGDLATARTVYRNVVGDEPGTLTAPPPVPNLPADVDATVAAAIAANPNVLAANYAEQASRANIDVVRGALLPTLSLNGTVQREDDTLSTPNRWRDTYTALLQLQIPIYQAGIIYSQLRAAYETDRQNRELLDQASRDARQSATTAWDALVTARARISSLQDQIQSDRTALEGVQQEALVGSRTVLDILNAEQTLLNSEVSLVRSQHDATIAAYQVRSAVGTLTASGLQLPVALYDPTKNYKDVRGKWFGVGKE